MDFLLLLLFSFVSCDRFLEFAAIIIIIIIVITDRYLAAVRVPILLLCVLYNSTYLYLQLYVHYYNKRNMCTYVL